ncbi:hypothetical protein BBR01nite_51700 [Brevibacillus brevis]|nr:hypothetical protein BBR01nite_51700 [Brevibacillus brevis]
MGYFTIREEKHESLKYGEDADHEWYQHMGSTNPATLDEKDHKVAKEIRKSLLESK